MKHPLFLSLILATTLVFGQKEKTITKRFSDVTKIDVGSFGNVTLKKSNGPDVTVTVQYTYDDSEFKPNMEQSGNWLKLGDHFPQETNSGGTSAWTVEMPDNMKIKARGGSVAVDDLTGDMQCTAMKHRTTSGDVTITSVQGEVRVSALGNAKLNKVDGEVNVSASGPISVEESSGTFVLKGGKGNVNVNNLKGDFDVDVKGGDILAQNLTISGPSIFNSNGNISIQLGASLHHDISVNSNAGNATLNFNGKGINGEVVMTAHQYGGKIAAPFGFEIEETIIEDARPRIQKNAKRGDKNIVIKVSAGSGTAEIVE